MTNTKAQTLLTDWAMSLIEPDHIPSTSEVNPIVGQSFYMGKNSYRSDIPLYTGGITLQDYRNGISRLLKRELTTLQLEAAFLYFAKPKNKYTSVSNVLGCHIDTVRLAVRKSIKLVKVLDNTF